MPSREHPSLAAEAEHVPPQLLEEADTRAAIEASESRNLFVLATHVVVLRIAWVFKTESVIIPSYLDTIAGPGWIRGCLPMLNRTGTSLASVLFAERLRRLGQKKWALLVTALLMAGPFLLLSAIELSLDDGPAAWLPILFLILYFAFFTATGPNRLAFGTIQGKLIRPDRRGFLMGRAGVVASVSSIACAAWLLEKWLNRPDGGYGLIFGFTGIGFAVSALVCLGIVEPADEAGGESAGPRNPFGGVWQIVRGDANFRCLAGVTMLFSMSQLLFPHYQALARLRLQSQGTDLMIWVIAQNAGVGVFSLIAGAIADRFGNRLAIRLECFFAALTPVVALWLTSGDVRAGGRYYWAAFVLLGMSPVTYRTLTNYTLEICNAIDHSRFLGALEVCMMVPFLLSPLLGLLLDWIGFDVIFRVAAIAIAAAGLLTFRLAEPRHV